MPEESVGFGIDLNLTGNQDVFEQLARGMRLIQSEVRKSLEQAMTTARSMLQGLPEPRIDLPDISAFVGPANQSAQMTAESLNQLAEAIRQVTRELLVSAGVAPEALPSALTLESLTEQMRELSPPVVKLATTLLTMADTAAASAQRLSVLEAEVRKVQAALSGQAGAAEEAETVKEALSGTEEQLAQAVQEVTAANTELQASAGAVAEQTEEAIQQVQEVAEAYAETTAATEVTAAAVDKVAESVQAAAEQTAAQQGTISQAFQSTAEATSESAEEVARQVAWVETVLDDLSGSMDDFAREVAEAAGVATDSTREFTEVLRERVEAGAVPEGTLQFFESLATILRHYGIPATYEHIDAFSRALSITRSVSEAIREVGSAFGLTGNQVAKTAEFMRGAIGEAGREIGRMAEVSTAATIPTEELQKQMERLGLAGKMTAEEFRNFIQQTVTSSEAVRALAERLGVPYQTAARIVNEANRQWEQQNRVFRSTVTHSYSTARAIDVVNSAVQGFNTGLSLTRGPLIGVMMGMYFLRSAILKIWAPMAIAGAVIGALQGGLNLLGRVVRGVADLLRTAFAKGLEMAGQALRWLTNVSISAFEKIWDAASKAAVAITEFFVRRLEEAGVEAQRVLRVFESAAGSATAGARMWLVAADWAIRYGFALQDVNEALLALWRGKILDEQGESLKAAMALAAAWGLRLEEAVDVLTEAIGTTEGNVEALQEYNIVLDESVNNMDFMARRAEVLSAVLGKFTTSLTEHTRSLEGAMTRVRTGIAAFWQVLMEPIAAGVAAPLVNTLANLIGYITAVASAVWVAARRSDRWRATMEYLRYVLEKARPELEFLAKVVGLVLTVAIEVFRRAVLRATDALSRFFWWIRQIRGAIQTLSGGSKVLTQNIGSLAGSFKQLTFQDLLQEAKNLLLNLVPNLDWILATVSKWIDMLKFLFNEFIVGPLKAFFSGFIAGFAEFLPGLQEKIDSITSRFEKLKSSLQPLADVFKNTFGAIGAILGMTLGTIATLVATIGQTIVFTLTGEINKVPGLWSQTFRDIGASWDRGWATNVAPKLEAAKQGFLDWVGQTFGDEAKQKVQDWVDGPLSEAIGTIKDKILGFFGVSDAQTVGEAVSGVLQSIYDTIVALPGMIAGMEGLKGFLQALKDLLTEVTGAFGLFSSSQDEAGDKATTLKDRVGFVLQVFDSLFSILTPLVQAITVVISHVKVLAQSFSMAGGSSAGLVKSWISAATALSEFVGRLLISLVTFWSGLGQVIAGAFQIVAGVLSGVSRLLGGIIEVIVKAVRTGVLDVGELLEALFQAVLLTIINVLRGVAHAVLGAIQMVVSFVGSVLNLLSPLIEAFDSLFPGLSRGMTEFYQSVSQGLADAQAGIEDFAQTAVDWVESVDLSLQIQLKKPSEEEVATAINPIEYAVNQTSRNAARSFEDTFGPNGQIQSVISGGGGRLREIVQQDIAAGTVAPVQSANARIREDFQATWGAGGSLQQTAQATQQNVFQKIGSAVSNFFTNDFMQFIRNVGSWFERTFGAGGALATTASRFGSSVSSFISSGVASLSQSINQRTTEISTWWNRTFGPSGTVPQAAQQFGARVTSVIGSALTAFQTSVWTPIVTAVSNAWNSVFGVVGSVVTSAQQFPTRVTSVISSALTTFRDTVWSPVVSGLSTAWSGVFGATGSLKSAYDTFKTNVIEPLKTKVGEIRSEFVSRLTGADSVLSAWQSVFGTSTKGGLLEAAWNRLKSTLSSLWDEIKRPLEALRDILDRIKSTAQWIINNIRNAISAGGVRVPGAQLGGIFYKPTLTWIAETRPEAVVPLHAGKIPVELIGNAGNGATINIYVTGNYVLSPQDVDYLVSRISEHLTSELRRRRVFVYS